MSDRPRALVTGASGFIGAHFVRYLAARGWEVRAIDVRPAAAGSVPAGVDVLVVDLRDRDALGKAIQGVGIVFNLASVHLEVHSAYQEFESVNVKALEQLVGLCASAGVRRLVQVSSVGVYGHIAAPPAREDAPLNPQNDYERTKRSGEDVARRVAAQTHLDLVILRPSWVYGMGCPRTEKLIGALRKGRFFYIGAAKNLRHPIFVDDFMVAMVLAAEAGPEIAGLTFNVAGPRAMTVREMVETFAQGLGVPAPSIRIPHWLGLTAAWAAELMGTVLKVRPLISRRTLAFFDNDNAFDISAARNALGFEPRTDLLDGVRRVLCQDKQQTA